MADITPSRRVPSSELTVVCNKCLKRITDDEYVVNWGSCSDCFDADYEEYMRTHHRPEFVEDDDDFS